MIYRWIVRHQEPMWGGVVCPSTYKRWAVTVRRLPSGLAEVPDVRCPDCLGHLPREAPERQFMYAEWMTFAA